MFNDMKFRPQLTPEEMEENRRKWVEELEEYRIGTSPVTSMERAIKLLEDNASDISHVMQDKEVNGHYSPHLQSVFDDTMDILCYLKELRIGK